MTGRATVDCAFCGRRGPQSKEHAWPDWIGKRLPRRGSVTLIAWSSDGRTEQRQSLSFTDRIPDVCEKCNTGWMRRIENRAIPILEPMIFGKKPTTLGMQQQKVVATWACLRMLVLQQAADPSTIPASYYRALQRSKTSPMQNCRVSIGALENPSFDSTFYVSRSMGFNDSPLAREAGPEAYVATYAVGNLILRTFLYSALFLGSGQLVYVTSGGFDTFLSPVWLPGPPVDWPPRVMDLAGFFGLARALPRPGVLTHTPD